MGLYSLSRVNVALTRFEILSAHPNRLTLLNSHIIELARAFILFVF